MVGRIETALPTLNETRLERLSGFQILILRKALTAFPKAKRVLYSTCSTMTKENEQVVKEVRSVNSSISVEFFMFLITKIGYNIHTIIWYFCVAH